MPKVVGRVRGCVTGSCRSPLPGNFPMWMNSDNRKYDFVSRRKHPLLLNARCSARPASQSDVLHVSGIIGSIHSKGPTGGRLDPLSTPGLYQVRYLLTTENACREPSMRRGNQRKTTPWVQLESTVVRVPKRGQKGSFPPAATVSSSATTQKSRKAVAIG